MAIYKKGDAIKNVNRKDVHEELLSLGWKLVEEKPKSGKK